MNIAPSRKGLRTDPIRVLDLFAGAGGMHQGFKRLPGFKTVTAVEMNPLFAKTFQTNNPGVPVNWVLLTTFMVPRHVRVFLVPTSRAAKMMKQTITSH